MGTMCVERFVRNGADQFCKRQKKEYVIFVKVLEKKGDRE